MTSNIFKRMQKIEAMLPKNQKGYQASLIKRLLLEMPIPGEDPAGCDQVLRMIWAVENNQFTPLPPLPKDDYNARAKEQVRRMREDVPEVLIASDLMVPEADLQELRKRYAPIFVG